MIEREKVIKGLTVCTKPGTRGCFYDIKECPYDNNGCRMALMRDALSLLKEQPEIVRCKDCKWFIKKFENEGRCIKHDNDYNEPDWFCADGTRKDS